MKKTYWKFCALATCSIVWLLSLCLVATVTIILWKINYVLALITGALLFESTIKKAIKFTTWWWPKQVNLGGDSEIQNVEAVNEQENAS